MPKRNSQHVEKVAVPKSVFVSQKLASRIDAKIKVTNTISGREYVFDGAGSIQDVDIRDVEWMLEKRQGEKQCCGGTEKGNLVFTRAEE